MYVASGAIRLMETAKQPAFSPPAAGAISNFRTQIDDAARFIPTWVKVALALALGRWSAGSGSS